MVEHNWMGEIISPHWTRFACGGSMLRVDCYDFYKLGVVIHPLTEIVDNSVLSDVWFVLYTAKNELDRFFGIFPLKTSLPLAQVIYAEIRKHIPDIWSDIFSKMKQAIPV